MVRSSGVHVGAFQDDFSYQKGTFLEAAYLVIVGVFYRMQKVMRTMKASRYTLISYMFNGHLHSKPLI